MPQTKTAQKSARRKPREKDITEEFCEKYNKNFNLSDIKIKNHFTMTDNQQRFYYLTQKPRTNMIFVDGPAGSSKTFLAVFSALEHLRDNAHEKIIYIRSVVESSSKSIGYLKGDESEKFQPYIMPMMDKLNELLQKNDVNHLTSNEYIKAIPVNFCRGLTFHKSIVIVDEAQNMTKGELTTILTRFGKHSKFIILGDGAQMDIKDSGFKWIYDQFNTDHSVKNEIYCVKFDTSDIVRSHILKHITEVLKV